MHHVKTRQPRKQRGQLSPVSYTSFQHLKEAQSIIGGLRVSDRRNQYCRHECNAADPGDYSHNMQGPGDNKKIVFHILSSA